MHSIGICGERGHSEIISRALGDRCELICGDNLFLSDLIIFHAECDVISEREITPVLLVNVDEIDVNNQFRNLNAYIISYGLNSRATITASSSADGVTMLCLQRNILDINRNIIEPQEIPVQYEGEDILTSLSCASAALILGVPPSQIRSTKF